MQEVLPVQEIVKAVNAGFGFFQCADQLIGFGVKNAVCICIFIDTEHRAADLILRVFQINLRCSDCTMQRVDRYGLSLVFKVGVCCQLDALMVYALKHHNVGLCMQVCRVKSEDYIYCPGRLIRREDGFRRNFLTVDV